MIRKIVIGFCFWFLILPGAYAADVARVVIEGNKRIERDAILAVIQSKPKSSMDRSKISQDVRSIYRMGFFKDVQVSFEEASGALTFKVVEKTSIREIVFSGNDEEKTEDLQKEVQTKAFTYLDDNKIREDVARLRKYYDGKGFYLADIASGLTPLPNNEARLTFKIQENKKVVVRRINILGNKVFSDSELKKVMQTKEKGLFSFFTQSGSYREEVLNADRQSLRGY
ncbi:MAG TPA: POTRA domain-containing protein, partial [Bdellovibrionota bacterium]|nr:POTRA domain-containing protein [Bdellovibrionota bacterium]